MAITMLPNQRDLLVLKYREEDHLTFREIGEKFNLTSARIMQLYRRALWRRKNAFELTQ